MKKKKIDLIPIVIILIIVVSIALVISIINGNTDSEVFQSKLADTPTIAPTAEPTPDIDLYIDVTGQLTCTHTTINLDISCNLADGTYIRTEIYNKADDTLEKFVQVFDGKASVLFDVPADWKPTLIIGIVTLTFSNVDYPQNDYIKSIYGEYGERILGDLVYDSGSGYKDLTYTTDAIYFPDEDSYKYSSEQDLLEEYKQFLYEGTGSDVIENITFPSGVSKAIFNYSGSRNFIVKLYDSSGTTLLVNEIGKFSGEVPVWGNGPFMMEIQANGSWTVNFEPIIKTYSSSFSGSGYVVSGYFEVPSEKVWIFEHSGNSNFIVYMHTEGGSDLVVNKIGRVNDVLVLQIPDDATICIWEVRADGEWSIKPRE